MARDGIADVTYVNPGYQPGRFPIAARAASFVFSDGKKGTLALNEWYHKYAPTEMKDTKLCFAFIHDPARCTARKGPLPSDLRDESAPGAEHDRRDGEDVRRHQRAGLGAGGARRARARRCGRDHLPWGSIFLFGIDKVVKYHMDVPLYTTVFTYNINLDKYNSMSPAQKKIIDDHCTPEWASKLPTPGPNSKPMAASR